MSPNANGMSHFVPSVLLSNAMSLAPKINKIAYTIITLDVDIALFTTTWLNETSLVYQLFNCDREGWLHEGVCC